MPTAPPNSGPKFRDIMKYDPPPGTTPLVEMAEREMAVNMVVQQLNEKNGGEQKKTSITSARGKCLPFIESFMYMFMYDDGENPNQEKVIISS